MDFELLVQRVGTITYIGYMPRCKIVYNNLIGNQTIHIDECKFVLLAFTLGVDSGSQHFFLQLKLIYKKDWI